MVKKIFSILAWIVTAAALVVLFIAAREDYLNSPVSTVEVDIERVNDSGFVKQKAVESDIANLCGTANIGTVNMANIKQRLNSNPWVEGSSSYIGLNGILNVKIQEYHPVLRIFDRQGRSAYVTENGMLLPPGKGHTPYVLVASGHFDLDTTIVAHPLCDTTEKDINILNAKYLYEAITRNNFIKNCVGQIYCNSKNEFEIVVRDLDTRIIVGDTTQIDGKLRRLETYMKQKAGSVESKQMKIINLKYKNQVVCTKR